MFILTSQYGRILTVQKHSTTKGTRYLKRLSTRYQEEAFSLDQNDKIKAYKKVSGSVGCDSNELDRFRVPPAR